MQQSSLNSRDQSRLALTPLLQEFSCHFASYQLTNQKQKPFPHITLKSQNWHKKHARLDAEQTLSPGPQCLKIETKERENVLHFTILFFHWTTPLPPSQLTTHLCVIQE